MLIEPVTCLHNHQYDAEAFSLPAGSWRCAAPLATFLRAQPRDLGLEIEALKRAVHLPPGPGMFSVRQADILWVGYPLIMTNMVIILGEPWLVV
jgi:hypothetical protein